MAARAADELGVSCRELARRFADHVDADREMPTITRNQTRKHQPELDSPLRELELDRAGTRAPAPGLADGYDRGRGQRAIRVGHPGPPGGRALSDLRHGWPAAASTGRWAGRPRNSIRARTTRRARVRPRTTLPVGRPQNTRAR